MKIDLTHVQPFLDENLKSNLESRVSEVYETIFNKTGAGNDFLGWVNLPSEIDESLLTDIEKTAADLRKKSDLFVVIGIGGSYLGARAVIEALQNHFAPLTGEKPLIVYAGHNMSEDYLHDLMAILDKKDYSLAVISKSGTTTEPAIGRRNPPSPSASSSNTLSTNTANRKPPRASSPSPTRPVAPSSSWLT